MPPTGKQQPREKRSRQSDVMSEMGNMDFMLGVFPSQVVESDCENKNVEMDLESSRPR